MNLCFAWIRLILDTELGGDPKIKLLFAPITLTNLKDIVLAIVNLYPSRDLPAQS